MNKFEVILYCSDEDGVFVGEVPELPGCCAHGENQETALANTQKAIELWLETAREFNDPIPAPKPRLMPA